ncbi:MAG: ParB/RepB/Spo0J family partition protein [Myxococcota bacterium]|nr:ParB/RepB/Spo0J family partition protein [Myxococcota bacterium]
MANTRDFQKRVADRSRRIAGDAAHRARWATESEADTTASDPNLLKRVIAHLPGRIRDALRDALGPDPKIERGRSLLASARKQMSDVRHREAALEAARKVLATREKRIEASELELKGRTREADRLIEQARRAARSSMADQRVPLSRLVVNQENNPRPVRGVQRLAANIKRFGQLTPMVVRPRGEQLELVTGYRRYEALLAARCTHALVRIVDNLDEDMAAALYTAENCFVDGLSPNAIHHLAERVADRPEFVAILELIEQDDDTVMEEIYLEDMAADAQHHLSEGAAWVATLRPHWPELVQADRKALEELIIYFARLAQRLRK